MRLQKIIAVFLLLFCGGFFIYTSVLHYDVTSAGGDFAEWVNNAYRFLEGDKPQRDFWLLFPVGEVIFPALMLKLFGFKLSVLIISSIAVSFLTAVVSLIITWTITKRILASSLMFLLMWFNGNPDVYFLFQISCAAFFIFYLLRNKYYSLLLCGVFAGISIWFRIYQSAPLIIAITVTLLLKRENIKKAILNFYLPFIFLASCLLFYYANDFTNAMDELFIQSVLHNSSLDLPYFSSLNETLRDDVLMWNWTISEPQTQKFYGMFFLLLKTVEIAFYYLSPLLIPVLLFIIFKSVTDKNVFPFTVHQLMLLFFTVWLLFFLPYGFVRAEVSRIEHISTPLYFALIIISFLPEFQYFKKTKAIISACLIILSVCIVARIYGGRDALNYSKYTVTAQNGSYREASGEKAKSIEKVLQLIETKTNQGDYIFYDGFNSPPLYFLTGRKNPTYYDSMIDVVPRSTDAKQNRIISALKLKYAKLYIHSKDFKYDKMPERSFDKNCLIIKDYLSKQPLVFEDDFYEVYQLD